MDKNWLNFKTVIVTGASSGMGKGIAEKLIKEHGCNVIGVARSEQKMQKFVEELGEYKDRFTYQLFDVSSLENWENFRKYLEDNRIQPDILINNAGILPKFDKFQHYTIEEIERAMNINFYSAVYSMHILLPLLLKSPSAAIINVDSSASLMSLAGTSVYSASKSALKSLTESLREELRGKCYVGIVCPGFTKTDIFRNQGSSDEKAQKMLNMVSTSCDKMVKLIMHGVGNQRELMVFGKDAAFMNYFGRIMPVLGGRLFSAVMKMSKLPLFDGVFKED
ncbi:MAG TPA: SDR family oxidoreductase [Candidatus Fimenecus excrementigallinarum]|uniref:SDR family oxidoreductase n=1 Tax=Candidatus Fimenecus excrementigallinarum TaxID=2840816 RepID=A0A9D1IFR1_9FIRM|nr:SDR family oxidoreductase [Candidatus Fimenecus excrementigallinarum]